jgi:hypothetical protein
MIRRTKSHPGILGWMIRRTKSHPGILEWMGIVHLHKGAINHQLTEGHISSPNCRAS